MSLFISIELIISVELMCVKSPLSVKKRKSNYILEKIETAMNLLQRISYYLKIKCNDTYLIVKQIVKLLNTITIFIFITYKTITRIEKKVSQICNYQKFR